MAGIDLCVPKVKGAFIIKNDRGLHTRPSTEIVKCAALFKSEIYLFCQRESSNAKSLLGILMMAATRGSRVRVEAEGVDAEEAIAALLKLAENNFNMEY